MPERNADNAEVCEHGFRPEPGRCPAGCTTATHMRCGHPAVVLQDVRVELIHRLNKPTTCKVWRDGVLVFNGRTFAPDEQPEPDADFAEFCERVEQRLEAMSQSAPGYYDEAITVMREEASRG